MLNEIKSSLDNYLKSESAKDSHMDDWSVLSEQQLKELELQIQINFEKLTLLKVKKFNSIRKSYPSVAGLSDREM